MIKTCKKLGVLFLSLLLLLAAGCSPEASRASVKVQSMPHPTFEEIEDAGSVLNEPSPGLGDAPTMSMEPLAEAASNAPAVLTPATPVTVVTPDLAQTPSTQTPEPAQATPTEQSVATTLVSENESSSGILEEGDESADVETVQRRLIELGYLNADATGYYGPKTVNAVAEFQKAIGLESSGKVNSETREKLFQADAERVPSTSLPLSGITIGLDPGHQQSGNSSQEPVAPGSSETKAKVSSGTEGVSTHVPEYEVNLNVGLILRDLLQEQGANVVMSRDTNDIDISNAERAQKFNDAGADLVVRLHCDGEDDQSRHGAFVLIPVGPYAESFEAQSREAAQYVLDSFVAATGANNLGLSERDDQTGFNWSEVPVINIEMGHMSNPEEDQKLVTGDYQQLCAEGIAQGIVDYFT